MSQLKLYHDKLNTFYSQLITNQKLSRTFCSSQCRATKICNFYDKFSNYAKMLVDKKYFHEKRAADDESIDCDA